MIIFTVVPLILVIVFWANSSIMVSIGHIIGDSVTVVIRTVIEILIVVMVSLVFWFDFVSIIWSSILIISMF